MCLLGLIWLGIWTTLANEHSSLQDEAARDTANLAHAFEENSQRILAGADQVLLALRSAYVRDGAGFDLHSWMARENSPDWLTAQLAIIARDGMSIATTSSAQHISIADRDHFIAQRDRPDDFLYISKPVLGRASGRWTIQLTRKILSPSGGFDGIVVLSVDCYELSGFYQSINLQQGYIALAGLDGVIRARGPVVGNKIGARIEASDPAAEVLHEPQGTLRVPGDSGGELTLSYRRLDAYPMVVIVAFADKQIFARYTVARRNLFMTGAAASGVVLALGFIWIRVRQRAIASQQALSLTLENMNQGLAMIDGNERVRVVNNRAIELLGLPPQMLASLRSARPGQRSDAERALQGALLARFPAFGPRPTDTLAPEGLVVEESTSMLPGGGVVHVITDVTERHLAERRIRHMAMHDHLTGLGNRVLLADEADHLVAGGAAFAVLLLDLNGFKAVNDTCGHDAGDELLVSVAHRLQDAIPQTDFVARYGGDEFAILSRSPDQPAASEALATRIGEILNPPFSVAGQELRIGASIGIALYPVNGTSRIELLRNADLAMYAAKVDRAAPFRAFDPAMADAVQDRLRMEEELRAAIGTDQLFLEYQPQFRASTLEIVGFEALVRWNNKVRGNVRPDVFIPIAEETGLIVPLGRTILEQACRCALGWPDDIRIAVNLSPVQFRDPRLPATVSETLRSTGLSPGRLELEVTEGVLIADERQALETLSALRAIGVGLTLDDFGTGYASLSYLRKFPFERIKLDRSFVQAQVHEVRARHILESVLALTRKLGLGVVAEGVETRTELRLLRQQNCQEIQGYLLGRSVNAAEANRLVAGRATGFPSNPGSIQPRSFEQPDSKALAS